MNCQICKGNVIGATIDCGPLPGLATQSSVTVRLLWRVHIILGPKASSFRHDSIELCAVAIAIQYWTQICCGDLDRFDAWEPFLLK